MKTNKFGVEGEEGLPTLAELGIWLQERRKSRSWDFLHVVNSSPPGHERSQKLRAEALS